LSLVGCNIFFHCIFYARACALEIPKGFSVVVAWQCLVFYYFFVLSLIIFLVFVGEKQKPKNVRFTELVPAEVDNA
jgi:hypothetical protein